MSVQLADQVVFTWGRLVYTRIAVSQLWTSHHQGQQAPPSWVSFPAPCPAGSYSLMHMGSTSPALSMYLWSSGFALPLSGSLAVGRGCSSIAGMTTDELQLNTSLLSTSLGMYKLWSLVLIVYSSPVLIFTSPPATLSLVLVFLLPVCDWKLPFSKMWSQCGSIIQKFLFPWSPSSLGAFWKH